MSELYQFIKKRTSHFSGVTCRKLYGLDAFYLNEAPFIIISSDERVVVKVEDFEVRKDILKIPQVTTWLLNEKEMTNWFVLPEAFNKKKNKLSPVLEMSAKVLLNPKKEKKKRKKKQIKKVMIARTKVEASSNGSSFFKKLMSFFS